MKEISLYILDIAFNAVKTGAKNIKIDISFDGNILEIKIIDDGFGMDSKQLFKLKNKKSEKFFLKGLGIPLFREFVLSLYGDFCILSKKNCKTIIKAKINRNHKNYVKVGDIGATMYTLMLNGQKINFFLKVDMFGDCYRFDTLKIKDRGLQDGITKEIAKDFKNMKNVINENFKKLSGSII